MQPGATGRRTVRPVSVRRHTIEEERAFRRDHHPSPVPRRLVVDTDRQQTGEFFRAEITAATFR